MTSANNLGVGGRSRARRTGGKTKTRRLTYEFCEFRWMFALDVVVPAEFSPGDANRDGYFDSSDLVAVFQQGEYEDGIAENSSWTEGD